MNRHTFPCASSRSCATHALPCTSPAPLRDCTCVTVTHGLLNFDVFPTPRPHSPALFQGPRTPRVPRSNSACKVEEVPLASARADDPMPSPPPLRRDTNTAHAAPGEPTGRAFGFLLCSIQASKW